MKIGILDVGGPPATLAGRYGGYPHMVEAMLGPGFDIRCWRANQGQLPERGDDAAGYVITGSPAGVYEDHGWIAPLLDWIRDGRGGAKLVGICFGHQAIAQALGGRVEKSERGWAIGLHRYDVVQARPWMESGAASFAIPVSHQDQVVMKPAIATTFASSAFTPFAGLDYGDAISFQGHPEFEPDYAAALIADRRQRLPQPEAAIASLAAPNDRSLVASWVRTFLSR